MPVMKAQPTHAIVQGAIVMDFPDLEQHATHIASHAKHESARIPAEVEALEQCLPDLLAKLRSVDEVELLPDESISPGGCEMRFGAGTIDARIETQLDRIAHELLGGS